MSGKTTKYPQDRRPYGEEMLPVTASIVQLSAKSPLPRITTGAVPHARQDRFEVRNANEVDDFPGATEIFNNGATQIRVKSVACPWRQ